MQVQIGLRGVVTTILPALVTWASANCSSNEVFIGAILKPLGRNDYRKLFKTPIFERWGKQFCLN